MCNSNRLLIRLNNTTMKLKLYYSQVLFCLLIPAVVYTCQEEPGIDVEFGMVPKKHASASASGKTWSARFLRNDQSRVSVACAVVS